MCLKAHYGNCDPETKDQEYCIFHKPNKTPEEALEFYKKFLEIFKPEIEELTFEDEEGRGKIKLKRLFFKETLNCKGFVFPKIPGKPIEYRDKNGNLWNELFTFAHAKFNVVDFSHAKFESEIEFTNAEFKESNFSYAEFHSARFSGAKFEYAEFTGAEFRSASFFGATLKIANFKSARFKFAAFIGTEFIVATFRNARFEEAVFASSKFRDAVFSGCYIGFGDFSDAVFARRLLLDNVIVGTGLIIMSLDENHAEPLSASMLESRLLGRNEDECLEHGWKISRGPMFVYVYRSDDDIVRFCNPQALAEAAKMQRLMYERQGDREKADIMFVLEMRAKRVYRLWRARRRFKTADGLLARIRAGLGYLWVRMINGVEWLVADAATIYGTSWMRILGVSVAVILVFAFLFAILANHIAGFPETNNPLERFIYALYLSIAAFTTLGSSLHPKGHINALIVTEAATGAVLMALLVAVIARKWMR